MNYKINWSVFSRRMAMIIFVVFLATMIISDVQYSVLYHL